MSAHTQAPWIMQTGENGIIRITDSATEGITIAEVRTSGFINIGIKATPCRKEREANAQLIAAAPDLLAALEQLLAFVSVRIDDPRVVLFDAARSAIAKARGTSVTPAAAPLQSRLPDAKLAEFGRWVLRVLEEHEEWSADTTDEIARFAFENGLAYDDGSFRSCEMPPLKSTEEAP